MPTYALSGAFGWAGGGKSGAVVDIWATSRFAGPPAEGDGPPSGSPDAGPVTTGPAFGSPGAFLITGIAVLQDYYVRIQYANQTYWGSRSANDLTGAPVASGVTDVTGDETSIHVVNGTTIPVVSLLAGTGDVTWSAGATATLLQSTGHVNSIVGALASVTAKASTSYVDAAVATAMPIGSITMFGGSAAPTNWHICDGSAISRTTYATLFSAYGTTWGVGDGSTTFNLPDLRDRFPIGQHTTLALGATGGSQTITTGNLPAHSHGVTDPGHSHIQSPNTVVSDPSTIGLTATATNQATFQVPSEPTLSATTGISTNNTGSGTAYLPPAAGINYIVRLL